MHHILQSFEKCTNVFYAYITWYALHSEGDFKDGCITRWTKDTISLMKDVIKGPVIVVGSGIGGWIMLQVALQNPSQARFALESSMYALYNLLNTDLHCLVLCA